MLDGALLAEAIDGCDTVFQLQAIADVRHGLENPRRDLEQNTVATSEVLEAMRAAGARRICVSSTGSVYGDAPIVPTTEDGPFPIQTSLYGASKVAREGMIGAYAHGLGFTGLIFRFVSVLGERYTHGHVIDFYRALKADPTRLQVLGDGRQTKSYLYVQDCVEAMLTATAHHGEDPGAYVHNLATVERRSTARARSPSSVPVALEPRGRGSPVARSAPASSGHPLGVGVGVLEEGWLGLFCARRHARGPPAAVRRGRDRFDALEAWASARAPDAGPCTSTAGRGRTATLCGCTRSIACCAVDCAQGCGRRARPTTIAPARSSACRRPRCQATSSRVADARSEPRRPLRLGLRREAAPRPTLRTRRGPPDGGPLALFMFSGALASRPGRGCC